MNKRLVLPLICTVILFLVPQVQAATFQICELSAGCEIRTMVGKNFEIQIKAENVQSSETTQFLELSWNSTNGGDIKFEESGTSTINANLLPAETKIYKAMFSASSTGTHRLDLTTDGGQRRSLLVTVTLAPEFGEMGILLPIFFITLSVLIYLVIIKNN